jgi:hypothetical protein
MWEGDSGALQIMFFNKLKNTTVVYARLFLEETEIPYSVVF